MKNDYYLQAKQWFSQRNFRERLLLVLVGCAVIYMIWNLFLTRPLVLHETELKNEILSLKNQISTLKIKTDSVVKAANENTISQKLTQQKNLLAQAAQLKQRLDELTKNLLLKENLPPMLTDISTYHDEINIISLKFTSKESLIPPNTEVPNLPVYSKDIIRINYELTFQGSFYKTIAYLQYLEFLKWHLYLDNLQYKVETYPNATVTLHFHILTTKAD